MINVLRYNAYRSDGIFGDFQFEGDNVPFCTTLSHAYPNEGVFLPIVIPGEYACVRGIHTHPNGDKFETFEIMGIEGHSGLLFHSGNYNCDSKGCTLIGSGMAVCPNTGDKMITGSRSEFNAWMQRLAGVDSFTLKVM